MAGLADIYGPQYTPGAGQQGGIVGPSQSDIAQKLMPLMQGPSPSDIQVVSTPEHVRREVIRRALMRARHSGHAKYAVDVGEPQITPQYSVEAGQPQIEQGAAQAANDAHIRAAIAAKLTRAPVMGIKDDSLLGMDKLAGVGVGADANQAGIPYGLDLNQLNGVERQWLQKRTR